ncbi:hypothetical protein EII20_04090 [Comamonadaceae bacterium OH2545_COT-014]|nr:hypothetical protein EII20_04090 [Comamonadaceae bacterium OH2545_COT-014]
MQALALSRSGQGICQFARQAHCRQNDPWVVRAVYEALAAEAGAVAGNGHSFPVRWEDDLAQTLCIDSDSMELDIVTEVARRAGRSLEGTQHNPWYDKVQTAGDLVRFFNAQPRVVG